MLSVKEWDFPVGPEFFTHRRAPIAMSMLRKQPQQALVLLRSSGESWGLEAERRGIKHPCWVGGSQTKALERTVPADLRTRQHLFWLEHPRRARELGLEV